MSMAVSFIFPSPCNLFWGLSLANTGHMITSQASIALDYATQYTRDICDTKASVFFKVMYMDDSQSLKSS